MTPQLTTRTKQERRLLAIYRAIDAIGQESILGIAEIAKRMRASVLREEAAERQRRKAKAAHR